MEKILFNKQEIIRFFTFSAEERELYDFFPQDLREKKEENMDPEEHKIYLEYKKIENKLRKNEERIKKIEKFLKQLMTVPRKHYNFFLDDLKERYKEAPFIAEIFGFSSEPDEKKKTEYCYSIKSALTLGALVNTFDNKYFSFLRKAISDNLEDNEKWVRSAEELMNESENWYNKMDGYIHRMLEELESGNLYQRGNRAFIEYEADPEKLSPFLLRNFLWLLSNVQNKTKLKEITLKKLEWIHGKIDSFHAYKYDFRYILNKIKLVENEILTKEK